MKTIVGVSNFFKSNTPKFAQIIGDIGVALAATSGFIMMLPSMFAVGDVVLVLPAILVTVNKYCLIGGAIVKFASKFLGIKEVKTTDETAK